MNTKRIFVKDLNANDSFIFPGDSVVNVCESRSWATGEPCVIQFRSAVLNGSRREALPGLSTVDLIIS